MIDIATALNPDVEILCEGCKRPLHEPASRALGRGPVCRRGLRDLARAPGTGQLALEFHVPGLDLPDHHA